MYSGDNFVRSSGDARKLADLQLYQFDAFEKGQNLHLNADPTTLEKMNQVGDLIRKKSLKQPQKGHFFCLSLNVAPPLLPYVGYLIRKIPKTPKKLITS
tara:strand:+ start:423 stop:719 length:297 start_codon:yes stop_codon:yes gene_type:complete